ncbi:hypothetical protein [Streptomyces sp. NPDC058086]
MSLGTVLRLLTPPFNTLRLGYQPGGTAGFSFFAASTIEEFFNWLVA